jgi:hypothetical protein
LVGRLEEKYLLQTVGEDYVEVDIKETNMGKEKL